MKNLIKVCAIILLFSNSCFAERLASITLDESTKKIIEDTYNKVLGAQTETIDGKTVYIIKVLTPDGHIQHFKIDAETGQLIS
jgi:uncharacterized membrane protein YkoI